MSYSINQTSPYDGSGSASGGGLRSSAGLDSVGQLRWSVATETETYLDINFSIHIHCINYGYHTTGALSTSLSCAGQITYATTKGSCDIEKNDTQQLNPDDGISTYHTYRFFKSDQQQQFTINFSVTANGNTVKGTSSGSIILTLGTLTPYTISYNANGGSWTGTAPSTTKFYGRAITTAAASTVRRDNYTFAGWKWKNSGNIIGASTSWNGANESDSFYAQWTLNYVKPTITNVTAYRVNNSTGAEDPNGTSIKVRFTYTGGHLANTTTPTAPTIVISTTTNGVTTQKLSFTGTTGNNVSYTSDVLSTYAIDAIHTVTIKLSDSNDTTGTTATYTVSMSENPIDLLVSGNSTFMGLMTPASTSYKVRVPSLRSNGDINCAGAVSCTNLTVSGARVPKITASTSTPSASDGTNGDVWLVYS